MKNVENLWNMLVSEQVDPNPQNVIEPFKARLQALIDDEAKLTSLCEVIQTDRALKREMLQTEGALKREMLKMKEEIKAKKTKEESTPKKVRANPMPDNQNTGVEDEAYCFEHTSDETESIIEHTSEEQGKDEPLY